MAKGEYRVLPETVFNHRVLANSKTFEIFDSDRDKNDRPLYMLKIKFSIEIGEHTGQYL